MRPLLLLGLLAVGCGGDGAVSLPPEDAAKALEDLPAVDAPIAPEDRPTAPLDASREDAADVLDAVAVEDLPRAEVAADVGHQAEDRPDARETPTDGALGPDCSTCYRVGATARCDPARGCVIAECREAFADCNRFDPDGCEADLSDVMNCGECGRRCAQRQRCIATRLSSGRWTALCVTP